MSFEKCSRINFEGIRPRKVNIYGGKHTMELEDYKQKQEEGFAKLQEMVEPFMAKSSRIQKSLNRIGSIFEEYIIMDIDWESVLDRVNDAIDTGEISELEAEITALTDFCEDYAEE